MKNKLKIISIIVMLVVILLVIGKYTYGVQIGSIGVELLENGKVIAFQKYNTESEESLKPKGEILVDLLSNQKEDRLIIGKKYQENLTIKNAGTMPIYARVTIYKNWVDEEGNVDREKGPDTIKLNVFTDNGWLIDEDKTTLETVPLYYTRPIAVEEEIQLMDSFKIDSTVADKVEFATEQREDGTTLIKSKKAYEGTKMKISVNVEIIQTHNAIDVMESEWGVKAEFDANGTLIKVKPRQ